MGQALHQSVSRDWHLRFLPALLFYYTIVIVVVKRNL